MTEVACSTCGGDGLSQTPHPVILPNGQPGIEIRIGVCSACTGSGRIQQ